MRITPNIDDYVLIRVKESALRRKVRLGLRAM